MGRRRCETFPPCKAWSDGPFAHEEAQRRMEEQKELYDEPLQYPHEKELRPGRQIQRKQTSRNLRRFQSELEASGHGLLGNKASVQPH